jgi:hypothetical protein
VLPVDAGEPLPPTMPLLRERGSRSSQSPPSTRGAYDGSGQLSPQMASAPVFCHPIRHGCLLRRWSG